MTPINSVTSSYGAYSKDAIDKEIQKGKSLTTGMLDAMGNTKSVSGKGKSGSVHGVNSAKEHKTNMLTELVQKLLNAQADKWTKADFLNISEKDILKIKSYIDKGGTVDPEIQAAAKEAISEDGFWGVEAVSDRLVDMAIALSGGDKSKYEVLKNSIDKGFKAAERLWGGELPKICYDTYEATMKKLAEYFVDEPKAE